MKRPSPRPKPPPVPRSIRRMTFMPAPPTAGPSLERWSSARSRARPLLHEWVNERDANSVHSLSPWGEGWGEGVTGTADGAEPPHAFLGLAKPSSPLPDGERARAATLRARQVTQQR